MEIVGGLILLIAGALVLWRGINLKEDGNTMTGLKFRLLLTGGASIVFGLIFMLR
jgi:hypothetical protein